MMGLWVLGRLEGRFGAVFGFFWWKMNFFGEKWWLCQK